MPSGFWQGTTQKAPTGECKAKQAEEESQQQAQLNPLYLKRNTKFAKICAKDPCDCNAVEAAMHNLPRCSLATAPSRLDLKPVRRTHNNKFYRGLLHLTWQFQRPLTFLRTEQTAQRYVGVGVTGTHPCACPQER